MRPNTLLPVLPKLRGVVWMSALLQMAVPRSAWSAYYPRKVEEFRKHEDKHWKFVGARIALAGGCVDGYRSVAGLRRAGRRTKRQEKEKNTGRANRHRQADDPHGGNGITSVLEITDIVDRLHLDNALDLDRLRISFVPRNDVRPQDNISVGRVSVYREGH